MPAHLQYNGSFSCQRLPRSGGQRADLSPGWPFARRIKQKSSMGQQHICKREEEKKNKNDRTLVPQTSHKLPVLLESGPMGQQIRCPWLYYIPLTAFRLGSAGHGNLPGTKKVTKSLSLRTTDLRVTSPSERLTKSWIQNSCADIRYNPVHNTS